MDTITAEFKNSDYLRSERTENSAIEETVSTYVMDASDMGVYRLGNCICGNRGWSNCWDDYDHENRLLSIT